MSAATIYAIAFLFAVVLGAIIGLLIEPQHKHSVNSISKEEYEKFLSQSEFASSVAHGGRKLCPDKEVFELIQETSEHYSFKFPPLNDI